MSGLGLEVSSGLRVYTLEPRCRVHPGDERVPVSVEVPAVFFKLVDRIDLAHAGIV